MADKVREVLDTLTATIGAKQQGIWRASFTVKEVLEKAEMPNTPGNQRYVIYMVNTWYPGSKVLPPDRDNGGTIDIKIRSV